MTRMGLGRLGATAACSLAGEVETGVKMQEKNRGWRDEIRGCIVLNMKMRGNCRSVVSNMEEGPGVMTVIVGGGGRVDVILDFPTDLPHRPRSPIKPPPTIYHPLSTIRQPSLSIQPLIITSLLPPSFLPLSFRPRQTLRLLL
jgi:hypothetical protein